MWDEPQSAREQALSLKLVKTQQSLHRARAELLHRSNGERERKALEKLKDKDWTLALRFRLTAELRAELDSMSEAWESDRSAAKAKQADLEQQLEKIKRDPIARVQLGDLTAVDFSSWRDARLKEVAPGSVRREMILLSGVLTVARRDWKLIPANPMTDVRKPSSPPPRDRMPTAGEIDQLAVVAGADLAKTTARAFHAFLFACETAMRAGEIVGLVWGRIDLGRATARLDLTKNGTAREVPLSKEAVRLLQMLPKADPVFGLRSDNLDALFRSIKRRAKVDGFTFHDSRHLAITRLSRKLDVLALARMVGHRNLSQLQAYYNESAEDLAKRLD